MNEILQQKLQDLDIPGSIIEFNQDEADALGLAMEDALSEEDALNARYDEVENE